MTNIPKTVKLVPGEVVFHEQQGFRISEVLDFNTVIAVNLESGRSKALNINQLTPADKQPEKSIDIELIADKDWKIANERYAYIKPLLDSDYGRKEVEARANKVGKSFTTLYRYLKSYHDAGGLEGLLPEKPGVKKGTRRISYHAEAIIKQVIEDIYLSKQRPTVEKVVQETKRRCMDAKLPDIPHANTIRARVREIGDFDRLSRRRGRDKALAKYQATPGKFQAEYPLHVVQIDHTKVDLILVDDEYRKPIGRPWITLAIDVFSRMVTGYYLSFDAPSATSIAMCVAHSVLPKEEWMSLHDVNEVWPVWGIMDTIHVDNGPDFRSETFRKACMMHSIQLDYRPVKQPRFGGHIERLIGTIMKEVHNLPGTTFSSVKERDNYNSEKMASMTISEFEKWLVTFISKVYHKRIHSEIGLPPEKKWEIGIFGNNEVTGVGPRPVPSNRLNFLLDFMPSMYRSVQRYGISVNNIFYYSDTLRHWINAEDLDNKGKKRKFLIRQDPRDISSVWFYDPELKQYFEIPYADQTFPRMSIWEYNLAKAKAQKESAGTVNEHLILKALSELRKQVDESTAKTKRARRLKHNRKTHLKKTSPTVPTTNPQEKTLAEKAIDKLSAEDLFDDDTDFDTFGDIA